MQYTVCTANFGPGNLREAIFRAAELGYAGIELTLSVHCPIATGQQERAQIRGWIEEAGLFCTGVHSIFDGSVRLAETGGENIAKAAAYLSAVADVCADVGGKRAVIGGGPARSIDAGQDFDAVESAMVQAVQRAAEHAATRGVGFVIEPLNRFETNYLCTLAQAERFARLVDRPNVGILCDTFHMNLEEKDICAEVKAHSALLRHVHLSDSNRCAPGEGHFDFAGLLATLQAAGYDGDCSVECIGIAPGRMFLGDFAEGTAQMERGLQYLRSLG